MEINKKELRQNMRRIRNGLTDLEIQEKSHKIFDQICNHPMYQSSAYVFSYASFRNEVDTLDFHKKVLEDGKILALPKVISKDVMEFHVVTDLKNLVPGFMGLSEPEEGSQKISPETAYANLSQGVQEHKLSNSVLMILPGLAYDRNLYRMGYGGGYYDRYLDRYNSGVIRCGAAFACQMIEKVPVMSYDQRMDFVVTEDETIERMNRNDA